MKQNEQKKGKFLTGKAVVKQSEKDGLFYTCHNQLYEDYNGELIFVPRLFETDGYTINNNLAFIGGGKMQWDIRPAIGHDFECKYHKYIKVCCSISELKSMNILRTIEKNGETINICENIPTEYLKLMKTSFNESNSRFKRMMKAVDCIKNWRINMMRIAVNFNLNWFFIHNCLYLDKLYKETI